MKYRVTRVLTRKEASNIEGIIRKGDVVYRYTGCTYGCISPMGTAVSIEENKNPFFEMPNDSIRVEENK